MKRLYLVLAHGTIDNDLFVHSATYVSESRDELVEQVTTCIRAAHAQIVGLEVQCDPVADDEVIEAAVALGCIDLRPLAAKNPGGPQ